MNGIPIRVMLALASIGAGVIHFWVTPDHFEEFALFGVFFLLLGVFQVVWAGAALLKPNAAVLLAGVTASAAVIATWTVSRTAGLPIGPEAGEAEPLGLLDVLATTLEGLIVLTGTFLLVHRGQVQGPVEVLPADHERRAA